MAEQLQQGLDALGLDLSAVQQQQLLDYAALIGKWNKVYNLTALREQESILTHHLLDCLSIVPLLRTWAYARDLATPAVLDVGSGAGLPGLVLAICQPDWPIHTIDTVGKKTAFMQQVVAHLQLKCVQVHHARVETLATKSPLRYDLITSRAFSSLADFVQWTGAVLADGAQWAAMKGKAPSAEEVATLPSGVHMTRVDPLQVPGLAAERCLVWLGQTP
jgi:16S rRNA (guanine527-N7)-methyltransferase